MESSYLKTFIEVVRTGSITKAAENLCVTQSAVSRRIQAMEKQYECSLLDRSGPLLKQTEKGQLLLEKALQIIELEQKLESEMTPFRANNSLSFISTPTFSTVYLPQILNRFVKSQAKETNLRFCQEMPESIRESLRRGDFDIAVIEHCPDFDLSEFETISLGPDPMVFAAAPSVDLSNEQIQVEELLDQTMLSCGTGCCTRILMERNLQAKGFSMEQFKQVIEITDLEMLLQSLVSGVGVAFIPSALINTLVNNGQLKEHRVADFNHYRNRSLVIPKATVSCGLVSRFAEQIITYFKDEISPPEQKSA